MKRCAAPRPQQLVCFEHSSLPRENLALPPASPRLRQFPGQRRLRLEPLGKLAGYCLPCTILVRTPIEMYSTFFHAHPRKTLDPASNYAIRNEYSHVYEVRKKKERLEVSARRLGADQAAAWSARAGFRADGHQPGLRTGPSRFDKILCR